MNEAQSTNTRDSSLTSSHHRTDTAQHQTDTAQHTENKEQSTPSEANTTVTASKLPTEATETETESSDTPKQETASSDTPKQETETKSESSETSKVSETKANKAQPNQKPSVYNMCLLLTFAICLLLQYTAYSRLLKNVKESPKVGYKWEARRDIKLPIEVPFAHIPDGDVMKLERIISAHYMTIAVFYAPWSRPSLRVIEYFSELVPAWADTDVEFVAINCWTQGTLCKESYNSWDYPQILIYHQNVDYIPYQYALSTYPSAFATELERLYEPVQFADSMEELSKLLIKHQRSVIGLFNTFEGNKDYTEFSKAALIHHLEYMDSYYVPFIVMETRHVDVLETAQLSYLIYKYTLFETLSPFEGRYQRLRHREILNWLKVSASDVPIKYLGHHGFNSLANNSVSMVLASPLHQNSENYVNYMRAVMSYKHCNALPELKIHCKPNRTCLNPCLPDQALSRDTILPCFLPRFRTPSIVQQCYFNRQRMSLMPRRGAAGLSSKMAEDLTVLTQHTFLESEVMCSESHEGTCTQCTEVEQLQSDLEFSIRQATNVHHTPYHGHGCLQSNAVFYALDTVIWADMVTKFGVNNTDRSFTEALVKTNRQGKKVFTFDLTNSSLDINEKFWTFFKGSQTDNSGHFQNPSGVNKKRESSSEETDADSDKEFIREISRLDLLSLQDDTTGDYLVFVYTKWCGYCHVMKRKLEAAARLLGSKTSVSFVAIDSDKNNNLYGSKLASLSDRIPGVYLLLRNSHSPVLFERRTEKPASVKDIIKFIKAHISGIKFHSSHNARVPSTPSIPCMSWLPSPPPLPPPNTDSESNFAHAQMSPIDTIMESLVSSERDCPVQHKLDSLLNTPSNKHTDNLPNDVVETMKFKEKSSVLQNRVMLCRSTRHLFKALSRSFRIDPYKINSVTLTLFRDLHDNECLKGDIASLWKWLGAGCMKGSWDRLPCKFLLVACELTNLQGKVPGEILMILEAQEALADKLLRKAQKAKRFNNGREPAEVHVHDFERFYMRNCYNFNNAELLFYLRGTCSYLCRLTCRTVNKLN